MDRIELTTQIQRGMRVLAQHGAVVLEDGQLALYDSRNALIAHARLGEVRDVSPWWLLGNGLKLDLAGTRYFLSLRGLAAAMTVGVVSPAGFLVSGGSLTKRFKAALADARSEANGKG